MNVRSGGSYTVDPKTGEERRLEGTEQPDQHRLEETATADIPTAPVAITAEQAAAQETATRRRPAGNPQTQE